mmetsp:Transcript_21838/g.45584  ORF Transcript_21838/g.45584 Transcript_21838/m.45584 type:complete len:596 (-) Transcript_21838:94-1881(-)
MSDSDSNESAVMVEHNDAPTELKDEEKKNVDEKENDEPPELTEEGTGTEMKDIDLPKKTTVDGGDEKPTRSTDDLSNAKAHQIVSIGNESDKNAFTFHQDEWNDVLGLVPPGWKVSVISVVGAFRTGKSFLLSWFLRYLYALERCQKNKTSLKDEKVPWYKQFETLGKDGFDWKAGSERNTTGIWMWSHPFFLEMDNGENVAVLLVDTQGMFDHETTMALTASIFGLSTLLSSYQIYNVDKRIQEDNLQQLALFCEYARRAMEDGDYVNKPFQEIEFLVRDWQHFEDDEDGNDFGAMEKSMSEYLETVLEERDASDLKETREQIKLCFEKISCYGLCHPGFAVTKKKYGGEVNVVEELFMQLLDRYCQRVFSTANLQPKQIHDRELTAVELGAYIQEYAKIFEKGEKFPTAATLLEATSSANNSNAISLSVAEYKDTMDLVAGPKCSNYVQPNQLLEEHEASCGKAMKVFKSIATFGTAPSIAASKKKVETQIESQWEVYESLNNSRNPFLGMDIVVIPVAIGLLSYILRHLTDFTCSPYSDVCKAGSELLAHTYAVVACFMLILLATKMKQVQEMFEKFRTVLEMVMEQKTKKD